MLGHPEISEIPFKQQTFVTPVSNFLGVVGKIFAAQNEPGGDTTDLSARCSQILWRHVDENPARERKISFVVWERNASGMPVVDILFGNNKILYELFTSVCIGLDRYQPGAGESVERTKIQSDVRTNLYKTSGRIIG